MINLFVLIPVFDRVRIGSDMVYIPCGLTTLQVNECSEVIFFQFVNVVKRSRISFTLVNDDIDCLLCTGQVSDYNRPASVADLWLIPKARCELKGGRFRMKQSLVLAV